MVSLVLVKTINQFLERLFWTFSIGACRRIVPDGQIDSEILCYTKYSPLLVHVVSVALVKIFTPARVVLDNIFTPALLCGECFENIHPCSYVVSPLKPLITDRLTSIFPFCAFSWHMTTVTMKSQLNYFADIARCWKVSELRVNQK